MDSIDIVLYELFFYGSVIAFDTAIYLWTTGIGKVMGDPFFLEVRLEIPKELRAVICLDRFHWQGIRQLQFFQQVETVSAAQMTVAGRKRELQFAVYCRDDIPTYSIYELHARICLKMSELCVLGRMFYPESLCLLWGMTHPFAGCVMISPA